MPWNQTAKSDTIVHLPDGWQFHKIFSGPLEFKSKWPWKKPIILNFAFSSFVKGRLKLVLSYDGKEITPLFLGEGLIHGSRIEIVENFS